MILEGYTWQAVMTDFIIISSFFTIRELIQAKVINLEEPNYFNSYIGL